MLILGMILFGMLVGAAAQLLLGHISIESTKEYIGTEQAEALDIARKYHL